jgi:hypothetical protein
MHALSLTRVAHGLFIFSHYHMSCGTTVWSTVTFGSREWLYSMGFKRVAHLITLLAESCCAAHVTFTLLAGSCCAWAGHASLLTNRGPKCVPPSVHLISIFGPSPTMESNIIPRSMPFKLSNSHLVQGKYEYKNAPLQYNQIGLHRKSILDKKCSTSRKETTKLNAWTHRICLCACLPIFFPA